MRRIRRKVNMLIEGMMKIIIAGVVAMCFLSLFTLLYDYSGSKIVDSSGSTDVKWNGRQFVSNLMEGTGVFFSDSNGYNNAFYIDHPEVLVMGDSHIEGKQVSQGQNLVSKLEENSGLSCYNIGVSTHFISVCADNIGSALDTYKPAKYVIIDTYTLSPDYDEMEAVIKNTRIKSQTLSSGSILYYVRKIPCFNTLKYQLERWLATGISSDSNKDKDYSQIDYDLALRGILEKIAVASDEHDVTPIIFYHPFERLCTDGSVEYQTTFEELDRFTQICRDISIDFVDMTEDFKTLYEEKYTLAHGFSNTAVGEGHLNKYGHQVIADRLSEVIMEDQE